MLVDFLFVFEVVEFDKLCCINFVDVDVVVDVDVDVVC